MDKLEQLRVFVRLAERRSFSAVGRDLHTTQSAVSKAVTNLERSLGAQLVSRSTRSVALTETGIRYYERCRQILADLDDADSAVGKSAASATGSLRIAAPVPFGLTFIAPRVARFQSLHPALEIDLNLNDQDLNLVEENIDVAIRLGHLASPGLIARKLGESPFVAVASSAYAAQRGLPRAPKELASHSCIAYTNQADPLNWQFREGADTFSVKVAGQYRSNNLFAIKAAALAGAGVARLPLWMVDAEIKVGSLRVILEDFPLPTFDIQAVFPSSKRIPEKVKLFVDFIKTEFDSVPFFLGARAAGNRAHCN